MSILLGPPASRRHRGWFDRGFLPHFDGGAVVQTITFRLADSLPRELYKHILGLADDAERQILLHRLIDEGRGSCLLSTPENAGIVADALSFFDGERYKLLAWVIMPNHVHAMIEQIEGHRLDRIVHSWKSFTAKQINRRLNSEGRIWARDYFDRYVRDERHYLNAICYIENNPVKAGLVRLAEDWAYSSAARLRK
jgi:REP element-mobilizing transposase RayT